jgi:hypothetical protein
MNDTNLIGYECFECRQLEKQVDRLEIEIERLKTAVLSPNTESQIERDNAQLQDQLHRLNLYLDKLEAENEALKINRASDAPENSSIMCSWCPTCKVECKSTDEDHCCVSCGVDVVWPTVEHIKERDQLLERLARVEGTRK